MGGFVGVYFAPVSGYHGTAGDEGYREGSAAQVMPALEGSPGTAGDEVEAFVVVCATGGVSFGRRECPDGPMKWSDEMPRSFFPDSDTEQYPALMFQVDQLRDDAQIKVSWFGPELPAELSRSIRPCSLDAVWNTHEFI